MLFRTARLLSLLFALPPGWATIVGQDEREVVVLVRCKGQIDRVVLAGHKAH